MPNFNEASKMLLRDHFAGLIAAHLIGADFNKASDDVAVARIALLAYKAADALMEARMSSRMQSVKADD